MSHCTSTIRQPTPSDARAMIVDGLRMLVKGVSLYAITLSDALVDGRERKRNADLLARFDERMLDDIGLSACDVERLRRGKSLPEEPQ